MSNSVFHNIIIKLHVLTDIVYLVKMMEEETLANIIKICEKTFELRPSARRTRITTGIDTSGVYYIAYPAFLTREKLNDTLKNDAHFKKIISRIEKNFQADEKHSYEEGETFLFSGLPYTLKYRNEKSINSLELIGDSFYLSKDSHSTAYDLFEKWYSRALYIELKKVLPFWTKEIGVRPLKINVKPVKSMWGSCSFKKNITFSTRLALVPPKLLEYVVVHELCHLKEMNHSPDFWMEVSKYLSDYKLRRKTLKKNAHLYRW